MLEIDHRIKEFIKEKSISIFQDKLVFSGVSGSLVYGGAILGKSDIDWFIVVDKLTLPEKVKLQTYFKEAYKELNYKFGFSPDINWPGELITKDEMVTAVNGLGVEVNYKEVCSGNSSLSINDELVSYYIWLCFIAFSAFVCGDLNMFLQHKLRAWENLIKYCFVANDFKEIKKDEIMNYIKGKNNNKIYFGWKDRYFKFDSKESHTLDQSIDSLLQKQFMILNRDGFLVPNISMLEQWITNIRDSNKRFVGDVVDY